MSPMSLQQLPPTPPTPFPSRRDNSKLSLLRPVRKALQLHLYHGNLQRLPATPLPCGRSGLL